MKPVTVADGIEIIADGTGKWRARGKTPFTIHFKPKNGASWDASPYRLLGLPVCNKQDSVVTISARLNNSKPLGWGRHCVGSAVALRDEKTTLGFVFPTTEPQYNGPAIFQDQLGKPNGHRHHWRKFFLLTLSAWCWRCTQQAATLTLRSQNFLLPGKPHRNESRRFMSYLTWINLDKYVLLNGQGNFIRWTNLKKNYLRNLPMRQRPNAMTSANTVLKWPTAAKLGGSVPKKLIDTGGLSTPKAILSAGACIAGTEAMTPVTQARLKEHYFAYLPKKGAPSYWLNAEAWGKRAREFSCFECV